MTHSPPALVQPASTQLLERIDVATRGGQLTAALRLILSNFSRFDDPSLLRERTAAALITRGRHKEALAILELVAKHYMNSGNPARALAIIKQLLAISPDRRALLDQLCALYHIRSPHLSEQARTRELGAASERLDLSAKEPQVPESDLFALAYDRAMDKRAIAQAPQAELPALPLLSLLPQEAMRRVVELISYEIIPESQPLSYPGQAPQELIWAASPNILVRQGDDFHRLPSGSMLGLNGFARAPWPSEFLCIGTKNTELLKLSGQAIAQLVEEMPDFENRLATLRRHALTERLLCDHALFLALPEAERVQLIDRFVGLHVPKGEYILRQHKTSLGLFILLEGSVDIVRQDDQWEITIASLSSGDVFGEIGLVSDKPAVAGVVTTANCILLYLSRDQFNDAAAQHPQLAKYAVNLANERLAEVNTTLSASDLAELE